MYSSLGTNISKNWGHWASSYSFLARRLRKRVGDTSLVIHALACGFQILKTIQRPKKIRIETTEPSLNELVKSQTSYKVIREKKCNKIYFKTNTKIFGKHIHALMHLEARMKMSDLNVHAPGMMTGIGWFLCFRYIRKSLSSVKTRLPG